MSRANREEIYSPISNVELNNLYYRTAVRCAWVAAVFCLLVSSLLFADYLKRLASTPSDVPQYQQLRQQVLQHPENEQLREQFRQLDLQLRREHFRHRYFALFGTWLLTAGTIVLLVSYRIAVSLRQRIVVPTGLAHADAKTPVSTQLSSVAVGSAILAALMIGIAVLQSPKLPEELPSALSRQPLIAERPSQETEGSRTAAEQATLPTQPRSTGSRTEGHGSVSSSVAGKEGPVSPESQIDQQAAVAMSQGDYPSKDEIARYWPRFRGPHGSGISAYDDIPTKWNGETGEQILWKTPVPLPGNSSPIVWDKRVFLTGATAERQEVYCFDADTGKLIWQLEVPIMAEGFKPDSVAEQTGYAAPTPATDGRRVFAMFATGDIVAADFQGNVVWSQNLGVPENAYGHATSLLTYHGLVIVKFDQGSTAEDGKSRLIALDAATGKTVYAVPRPVPNSWSTPIIVNVAGRNQLITCGDPWVIAYDPSNGQEIWRAKCLMGDVGPSPGFADGIVQVGNEYCSWSAIKADGEGDVTETHILWTAEEGLPDCCSPLVTSEYVILTASYGLITCYEAKTGKKLWELELEANFMSSPGMAGQYIYQFGEVESFEGDEVSVNGYCWVIKPGPDAGEIVAQNPLGEGCVTSPAFQPGRIYIRGKKHLFCIGK